ncbi:MAG: amino acid adenylation domain-containing protein, partial [Alcanivoracaceae bacterium]|nr:amino acid adenylation domain-containing protein [Alcanivoracaceae bacterium]
PAYKTFNGAAHSFKVENNTLKHLNSITLENQVTMFMLIHAAFSILLSRYSNSSDIVIGTPVANRLQKELQPLIGFFVNTLVLRADCANNPSFLEFLKQIKKTNLDAQSNQDVSFEHLVDRLKPNRSTNHNALFQVMLSMNTNEVMELTLPNVSLKPQKKAQVNVKFDLVMKALPVYDNPHSESSNGLYFTLDYNTDLFSPKTIKRLANSMNRLLDGIAADANQTIMQLPLLGDKETHHLLHTLNDTKVDFKSDQCIHQLFEIQVAKTPNNIALIYESTQVTYAELNHCSNQLAHFLIEQGASANDFVGLYLERSLEMMIAIFAILKTGAAYLPLDPNYPKNRISDMITDSELDIVLPKGYLLEQVVCDNRKIIALDDEHIQSEIGNYPITNPVIKNLNNTLVAYMIYTSGSTGKPKGVTVEHKSIVNYIQAVDHYSNNVDGAIFITNFSFDGTVTILLPPLTKGQFIKIIPDNNDKFEALASELVNKQMKYLFKLTPSFLDTVRPLVKTLIKTSGAGVQHTFILGGESLYSETYNYWSQLLPESTFLNHYGPTETTVGCSTFEINKKDLVNYSSGLPIGKPLANYLYYILDAQQNLLPYGTVGELYIGGAGLARGYLNQPDLTAERFIKNPFINNPNERMYRSGDLVRYLADGNVEFLGRIDHQVKIRGFRIELGEIESQLNELDCVGYCVVTVHVDKEAEKRLLAYLTSNSDLEEAELIADIRQQLQTILPAHMIPSLFIVLEKMPLNSSGKIDRKSLPKADAFFANVTANTDYLAPEGMIEITLCMIWSELLKLPINEISANADFFKLGGHSLLSVKLVAEVRSALSIELAIRDVFEYPQLSALALAIAKSHVSQRLKVTTFERKTKQLITSFAQQRLWFIDQMDGGSAHYNMPSAMRMHGDFNVDIAQAAFTQIIQRHETLRTVFIDGEASPLQIIQQQFAFKITQTDLSQLSNTEQDKAIDYAIKQDARQSFNLSKDLMLRVSYLRKSDDEGVMLFNIHHIASDGWSNGLLVNEFVKLYRAKIEKQANPLEPLTIQYADYAHWQRNWLSGAVLESQLSYWDKQLADLPLVHNLPLDFERPAYQTFNGASHHFKIDSNTLVRLNDIALKNQATLFMLIHAAFSILLSRYSNSTDIVIATPVANRLQKELESLIGFFVNTLILRADCANNPTFTDLLLQI